MTWLEFNQTDCLALHAVSWQILSFQKYIFRSLMQAEKVMTLFMDASNKNEAQDVVTPR